MPEPTFDQTVKAELAPLGVPLWPAKRRGTSEKGRTLRSVSRMRLDGKEVVAWQFANGRVRLFAPGEDVAVRLPAGALAAGGAR